jgi:pimeloyl-ACP methyl ester carboxylesterase
MIAEKYFTVNEIPIRLLVTGTDGKAILFVHGNSCNAEYWADQLNDAALQSQYQLIAFDLPGHGKSGKHPTYQLSELAQILPALIKQLHLEEYILTGLSFGTCLIAESAPALQDCKGFFLASPCITNDEYTLSASIMPFDGAYAMASASIPDEVLSKFVEQFVANPFSPWINRYKTSYLQTDPAFRVALGNAIQNQEWTDEFANLENTGMPSSIVFGKEEKILNIHYLDHYPGPWNHTIHEIDNCAHFVNAERPGQFNKLLKEFAEEAFR